MKKSTIPATDLNRLREEVLCKSPDAALPKNLFDHWLQLIERDLEQLLESGVRKSVSSYGSAPFALIIHIFNGKMRSDKIEIPFEDLYQHLYDHRLEINLEIVSRKTDTKIEPATLETIFTNRDIAVKGPG